MTDTDCELWYSRAQELDIKYIKMPYFIDGQENFYDFGENTDFEAFYKKVRSGIVPVTMALNCQDYLDFIEPFFASGEDVLYVSFSHAMSGTFNQLNSAIKILNEKYPERKITVFDTKCISASAGIMVEEAALLKKKGASDEEILAFLEEFRDKIGTYFIVDDLMHLKRGGRLSAVAACAGSILALKPMLTYSAEGGLSVVQKISGRKKSMEILVKKVTEEMIEIEDRPIYVVDADCKEDGDKVKEKILAVHPKANIVRMPVGPVIGAHCGPGTIGVIYTAKQRPIPLKKDEE